MNWGTAKKADFAEVLRLFGNQFSGGWQYKYRVNSSESGLSVMKRAFLSAVMAIGATSAFAADLPLRYKAPPPVAQQVFSWTGFYIGGYVGGASARHSSAQVFDGGLDTPPDLKDYPGGRETGVFGGGTVGYNWQFNNVVFGIEGEGGYIGINGTRTITALNDFDGSASTVKYGGYGVIAGRLGIAFDRALLYVKGGAAFADIRNRSFEFGETGPMSIELDEDHRVSKTHTGWAAGVGLEYAFAPNWSGKVEYLHMDFGSVSTRNAELDIIRFRNEVDTVKVGFNYRFGGYGGPVVARY
jgi:outer membrane immunogenic protein